MNNLGFDDITLVPRVISRIVSRDDISLKTKFNNSCNLSCPIIASPMKDVCNGRIAKKVNELGGLGIIHRFNSIEEQCKEFLSVKSVCACAIGLDDMDRFMALHDIGCQIFCIDTANGANYRVEKFVKQISHFPIDLIIGNVASKECYEWAQSLPCVRGIRTGISGGTACTTKNATGICYGMVSSIQECASVKNNKVLLIADGGIREPADMCKAIALGADVVMLGSTIAATFDSPADLIVKDNKFYKVYHGSASFNIQKAHRNNQKYIEGAKRLLEFNDESLESMFNRFCNGLRSCMSYFNAMNIEEFRRNVNIVWNE